MWMACFRKKKTNNMNTIFKHKILAGAMLCGALLIASSCEDSEGLKVTAEVPYADKTMFEVMTSDPELSDFVEVINSCGEHCADSLFNKSRVYTVWAPKNGSFNKDSLIKEVQEGNREQVFKRFVKAHVANHLRAANGQIENKILLLNDKVVRFEGNRIDGYTFDGQAIEEANIRTWNGILHKLAEPSKYKYSIWEYLSLDSRVDSVAEFLYAFDITEFSPGSSVMGPIVNGEQTYLDSVFVTKNKLLSDWEGVGKLNVEDSIYTVYVPTNEAWNEVVELATKHFNYHTHALKETTTMTLEVRDSLRNHYARMNAIKYMTYSDNDQRYIESSEDSIYPIWKGTSVFTGKHLFAKEKLEENVIFEEKLSNGTFKIIDKSPFTQFELWHDTIKIEGENENMRTLSTTTGVTPSKKYASKDDIEEDSLFIGTKLSGNSYYEVESTGKTGVKVSYKLPDVLSASYKVAVIVVPAGFPRVVREGNYAAKASQFQMTLTQPDANNKSKTLITNKALVNDPFKVDTLYLEDSNGNPAVVSIPYCEYFKTNKQKDYGLSLEIQTVRNAPNSAPDRSVRIDAILLIPVEDAE